MARVWDEQILELIRQVVPAPTVHARNLFHVSAAMWDAWAAYDPTADGYFVTEKHTASDVKAARENGHELRRISHPALALRHGVRPPSRPGGARRDDGLPVLSRPTSIRPTATSPAALGNRIAAAVIAYGATDGANEDERLQGPELHAGQRPARGRRTRARS